MWRDTILDLALTSQEEVVSNVKLKGKLVSSDREMMEFEILRAMRMVYRKLSTWDFENADFGLFRDLLG